MIRAMIEIPGRGAETGPHGAAFVIDQGKFEEIPQHSTEGCPERAATAQSLVT